MCFDGEPPDFYCESIKKAKKEHVCFECRNIIKKKDSYIYVSGKWNGEMDSFKFCQKCWAIRDEIEKHEMKEGCYGIEASVPFGMLMEVIHYYPEIDKKYFKELS